MPKSLILKLFSGIIISILAAFSATAENDFPARKNYPNVPYISIDDLYKQRDKVTIVDTRSAYEHKTLHIRNSVNIPISSLDFSTRVRNLYAKNKKTIIFYCNGHSCVKSYNAVIKAKRFAKVSDTLAFDAGILDWTRRYPAEAVLLNESPVDLGKLISLSDFNKHTLKPKAFLNRANNNCIILDIRDSSQRSERIFAGYEQTVNLNDTLDIDKYILDAKTRKMPLCIYDAVGKQVRWLQYHLKKSNFDNFYFLEGGAKAFFETPYKELYEN